MLALLMDKGPRPSSADLGSIVEEAKKTLEQSERIKTWLKAAVVSVIAIGAHEVIKDLTAPLWKDVAHKIVDLYHAIEAWVSLLL